MCALELTLILALLLVDFFTKNLHYATSWWSEHCENFEAMLSKLMTAESLCKLAVNAAKMTLGFNAKTRWIDEQYNADTVSDFYGTSIAYYYRIRIASPLQNLNLD